MRLFRAGVLLASLVACAWAVAVAAEPTVGWKGSSKIEDKDNGYSIKFGGRIMNDWTWVTSEDSLKSFLGEIPMDGTEFRRARLFVSGTMYHVVEFKAQYDFTGGDATFKDMWVGLKKVPLVGRIRVGHQHEPMGLETITSSKVITFMERALTSSLHPERKTGIRFLKELDNKRATFSAGVYRRSGDYGDAVGNDYNYTGRATVVALNEDDGKKLVHLGASASLKDDGNVRIRTRPEAHQSPRYIDTGSFATDGAVVAGGELAAIFGPASVQGEYYMVSTDAPNTDDPVFSAFYAQAAFTVTGEHRGYKGGVMDGIKPKSNFDGKGGTGALEVAGRVSMMDLNDAVIEGGELMDITVGLNWYLNPYTRVMLNYVRADVDGIGASDIFMTRFQVSF